MPEAPASIAASDLAELVDAIASTAAAPGSGAAGAIALALGVACARKALRLTLAHHPDEPGLAEADARLEAIAVAALAGAQEDARSFAAFIAAMRLPHGTDAEQSARTAATLASAAALVSLAERLVALGAEALALLEATRAAIDGTMRGDVIAARALIAAAATIQRANAAENRHHAEPSR